MKIAVWHNLPSGGAKRALYTHVQGLIARGHTVQAWCPSTADPGFLPLSQLTIEHRLPIAWDMQPAPNPISRILKARWNVHRMVRVMHQHCEQVAERIHAGKFDVLFANTCQLFFAAPIGRFVQLPKALYLQEPARFLYESHPPFPWAAPPPLSSKRLGLRTLAARLIRPIRLHMMALQVREECQNAAAYGQILVNSLFSRESVLRTYALNARVCYLGVDTDKFVPLNLPRENVIIGLSSFLPSKNIEFVIEAVGLVRSHRPKLIWVGNMGKPEYLEQLRALAGARNVELELAQHLEDAQVLSLMNRALAMGYAPHLEPFGLAPVEANACGTPVIAVAEGGVRESILDGYNGLHVQSPAEMARAIERLQTHPQEARRLGDNGRKRAVELFSLQQSAIRLEENLLNLVTP